MPVLSPATDLVLRVRGTVQGVGFRPFVQRTATQLGLTGWVLNDSAGVLIRVQGDTGSLEQFKETLAHRPPPAAVVHSLEELVHDDTLPPVSTGFQIVPSVRGPSCTTAIPADLGMCADCSRELFDPSNRRYRYPFINCTQCGPRYSLIEALPYDRAQTTMRHFEMCPSCAREYADSTDRRFHAEPNACPACGPRLTLRDPGGTFLAHREVALSSACAFIRAGGIVAVKGIGGYHLMCDATNLEAVSTLRLRKHRDAKPLAVMFRDLAQLTRFAVVSRAASDLLTSPAAPIVLAPARPDSKLAADIAPGNPWIGALLPSNPLHLLLLDAIGGPIVATSANLAEEPLCTDPTEARRRLAGIADVFLEHDRPIARAIDDSVVRLTVSQEPILLRRARGFAPAPLHLPDAVDRTWLCVGGHLKNTIAVAHGERVVLSPHLGDLESLATKQLFERTIATFRQLHHTDFAAVAHDKHPDYASTHFARTLGLPTLAVQHHLAHVLACLLENQEPAEDVLGIVWDGTGYGEDGTVWGGEFLLLRGGRAERFARLRPFALPGGEVAARDARRVVFALAEQCQLGNAVSSRLGLLEKEVVLFRQMLAQGLNAPRCSSGGRLFDAFAALLALGQRNAFEGQLPLALEATAMRGLSGSAELSFPVVPSSQPGARFEIDWREPFGRVAANVEDIPATAAAFHRGLAEAMTAVAREAGARTVVLTGGCFQNALLYSLAHEALSAAGFTVLSHRELSPNDNSIAAGQALAALLNLHSVDLPA